MRMLAAVVASVSLLGAVPTKAEPSSASERVREVAPALQKYRDNTIMGDLWKRPGLSSRDRSIVTLAALMARNHTIEMQSYLNLALDSGLKPSEISEMITHIAFYGGWANALSAAFVAKDVFASRKIEAVQLAPSPQLLAINEVAEANRAKRVDDQFGAIFPGLVQYTTEVLFRNLWLRPDLAPRDRSLVTVSALIANNQGAQLAGHINIGLGNGLKQEEIAEAITHLAFYVGWPNAFSAMQVAKDVFEKRPR